MSNEKNNRREFLKMTALSGIGIGMSGNIPHLLAATHELNIDENKIFTLDHQGTASFIPRRAASWW